ncbi:MAG: helix-turn-helix transcriptional regulator [Patescibacteria group bacterium]
MINDKTDINIGSRIKELRNINNYTQEFLAHKAGISYSSLIKIESGAVKNPSINIIEKISHALEVQMENITSQSSIVKILNEEDCISKLLDDVYFTLLKNKGEVFISGIDESKFLKLNKKLIMAHIRRLTKAKIKERLLSRDGDINFFSGPQSIYRWVPENMFNPTPIYVYGNKLAIIVWGPPQQVVIIENFALADAYRKQFLFIWERAKVPPKKKVTEDERDRLQETILRRFGGRVSFITSKDTKLFRNFLTKEKHNTYGNSFYYLCQAANGLGPDKLGLKYFDGEMLATIGIFNRVSLGGGWHFHIVHPMGKFEEEKLRSLATVMMEISGNPVYIKKINKSQTDILFNVGFSSIEQYSWHSQAMEEDDTFPEQTIEIKKIIKEIENPGRGELKDKYLRFISKYKDCISSKNLEPLNYSEAQNLVNQFFEYLEIKEMHISTPSDYSNLIYCPPIGTNGRNYFTQIIYIDKKPCAFFAAEKITYDTVGLYANITLYQEYSYLSEYLIIYICKMLYAKGYKYLNLGGSETSGLFQFKDKFSPVDYRKMHWAVFKI